MPLSCRCRQIEALERLAADPDAKHLYDFGAALEQVKALPPCADCPAPAGGRGREGEPREGRSQARS